MSILSRSLLATAAVVAMMWNIPAHALSMHECSVKYHAAQTDKTLNGMTWKDFRKAECGPGAAAAPTSTSTKAADTAPAAGPKPSTAESSKSTRIYNTAPAGDAVLPAAVSPKYAGKSTGKARMLTCLDQYEANKAGNMNGGLMLRPFSPGLGPCCQNPTRVFERRGSRIKSCCPSTRRRFTAADREFRRRIGID
jgi:hypothetical protein